MWIRIMSRREACRYCNEPHTEESVIISLASPRTHYQNEPYQSDANRVLDILSLCFSDAVSPGTDAYGNEVREEDLMSYNDAKEIAEFVSRYSGVNLIVHCDAGISRSAGVAAAIMKYLTGNDAPVFGNGYYHPNMLCYRKTLIALHQRKDAATCLDTGE